jgi:hypothetical protein
VIICKVGLCAILENNFSLLGKNNDVNAEIFLVYSSYRQPGERMSVYRGLFEQLLSAKVFTKIRDALNAALVPGNERFSLPFGVEVGNGMAAKISKSQASYASVCIADPNKELRVF